MKREYSLSELAAIVGGEVRGDGAVRVRGVADVNEASEGDVTWVTNPKYIAKLKESRASAALVGPDFGDTPMPAIICPQIDRSVAMLFGAFAPPPVLPARGIHPSAVVHETARLGQDCAVGPGAVIDRDAVLGDRCVLHANAFIGAETQVGDECVFWPGAVVRERCGLGSRVKIYPNAVIGADGFGYYFHEGGHRHVPHIGGVILEDDVEVGACACVDRAKFGNTVIGQGTKIDNLVQVGHNVRTGKHCLFAGQSGISGSVRLEDYVVFGGQVGVADNITLGRGMQAAIGSMITRSIEAGTVVSGMPAWNHRQELRVQALTRRLPALVEQIKDLTARVQQLETSADHSS